MSPLIRLLPLLLLLATGCARLPLGPGGVFGDAARVEEEVNRLRAQARVLRYSGRYGEALARLDSALWLRPESADLRAERVETEKDWRQLERGLRDALLVIETRTDRRRLPLLQRLVRASPEDRGLRDEMHRLLQGQIRNVSALSSCGHFHAERDPGLASQCLELALAEREDAADRQLLARLRPPAAKVDRPRTRKAPPPGRTGSAVQPWMVKSRELMKSGNFYAAVRLLEGVLAKEPGSGAARRLLEEARAKLERNMDTMLTTGDRLYRQGRVKEALAVWQAAVEMDPESLPAREKSERAIRVLNNIDTLRKQP